MTKTWLRRTAALGAMALTMATGGAALAQDQVTINWALWDWG